jgi:hypothetical protein
MIVFPLIRSVGLKAATASSRVAMLPMFGSSGPDHANGPLPDVAADDIENQMDSADVFER